MTRGRAYLIEKLRERGLSYRGARRVLNELVNAMKEALRNGEAVELPFGTLEVTKQSREAQRGWHFEKIMTPYKHPHTVVLRQGDSSDIHGE